MNRTRQIYTETETCEEELIPLEADCLQWTGRAGVKAPWGTMRGREGEGRSQVMIDAV